MRGFTLHTVVVGTDTMNPYGVGVHANDTRSAVRRLFLCGAEEPTSGGR
jgi:hypothetical protein